MIDEVGSGVRSCTGCCPNLCFEGIGGGAQLREEEKQLGQTIGSFQVTQFKIAEMATLIEAARSLVHKARWNLDRGNVDTQLSAIAK